MNVEATRASCATLYFDGACELCVAEMRRLQPLLGDDLQLRDIHEQAGGEGLPDRDTLLRSLHYRDANGRMLVGLEANVAAWQHTRFGRWWRLLLWPPVKWLAEPVYNAWARWRYRRLYH